jgi:hypothetical protein
VHLLLLLLRLLDPRLNPCRFQTRAFGHEGKFPLIRRVMTASISSGLSVRFSIFTGRGTYVTVFVSSGSSLLPAKHCCCVAASWLRVLLTRPCPAGLQSLPQDREPAGEWFSCLLWMAAVSAQQRLSEPSVTRPHRIAWPPPLPSPVLSVGRAMPPQ